jgi:hypothetical protein
MMQSSGMLELVCSMRGFKKSGALAIDPRKRSEHDAGDVPRLAEAMFGKQR